MKRFTYKVAMPVLAALVMIGATASSASAIPIIPGITRIKMVNAGYPGSNGEFGAFLKTGATENPDYASPSVGNEDFRTFCAEAGESFSPGVEYKVAGLTLATVATGKNLTKEAAWLFREFSQLAGSSYVGNIGTATYNSTTGDSDLLQSAIWWLIGGQTHVNGSIPAGPQTAANNKYILAVQNAAATIAAMSGYGGVRILNIQTVNEGWNKQDQLWWNGTPDNAIDPVPEPMSAALWLFALAGGTMVRRRQKRQ